MTTVRASSTRLTFHAAGVRNVVLLALGYSAVTLLFTYPLVLHLGDQTPALGLGYAAMANASLIDEAWHAVRNPLVTERILYPTGYTLHEGLLPSLLVWLGAWDHNYLLGWNLLVLTGFVFAGLGASLLVYGFTGLALPSFLAGLFFAFSASQTSRFEVYPLVLSGFLPLAAYALLGFLGRRKASYLILWGTCFGLGALSSWYFGVFIGLLTGIVWMGWGGFRDLTLTLRLTLAALGVSLVVLPFTPWALLGDVGTATGGYRFFVQGSADLLSFLTPPQRHWLLASWIQDLQKGWAGNSEIQANYLGTVSLLIGLLGLLAAPPRLRPARRVALLWLLTGVVLALGPELQIHGAPAGDGLAAVPGETGRIRLPYTWLIPVFPFSATRTTARYSWLALLAVVVGVGLFLARLWTARPRFRSTLVLLSAGVFGLELWPSWPQFLHTPELQSPALNRLAAQVRPDQTVLLLPLRNDAYRTLWLAGRLPARVMGGAVDKPFERFRRYGLRRPFFRRLLFPKIAENLRLWREDVFPDQLRFAPAFFQAHSIAYVVVCRWDESLHSYGPYRRENSLRPSLEALIRPHVSEGWEDEDFIVYVADPISDPWVYPAFGEGWSNVIPHPGYVAREIRKSSATLLLTSSQAQVIDLTLTFHLPSGGPLDWVVRLNGHRVNHSIVPLTEAPATLWQLRLEELQLEAGENRGQIAWRPANRAGPPPSLRSIKILPSAAE